jgi:hypothetical protein
MSDVGIGRRRTGRNALQGLPDALLKCGPLDIERKIQPERRRFHKAHHGRHDVLERGRPPRRSDAARESVL